MKKNQKLEVQNNNTDKLMKYKLGIFDEIRSERVGLNTKKKYQIYIDKLKDFLKK
jgi:hypothetical protein